MAAVKKEKTVYYSIPAHGKVVLTVVYTNNEDIVDETLAQYEKWLEKVRNHGSLLFRAALV